MTDDGHNGRGMSLHGSTQVVKQISAVPDEPLDAVCHEQRVINEGGRSVWQTCDGRRAVVKRIKIGKVQSWEQGSRGKYSHILEIPEFS